MIERREYGEGTYLTMEYPRGVYRGGRVLCSDGRVRNLKRIASTADTFYSVPASVTVSGRTVAGYVTVETRDGWTVETEGDPAVAKFIAYSYGANGSLLPAGSYIEGGE